MKNTILALALLASANVMAHVEFVGTIKGGTEPCSLEIEQTYFENNSNRPEDFRAEVVVHLEADDHNHLKHNEEHTFIIKPGANALVLNGVGSNQKDQLNVLRQDQNSFIPVSFAMKWLHINHYHTVQCVNLKPAHD
nr:hypothetical protein BHI3_06810 [Bacteriovorax sp. HI3]